MATNDENSMFPKGDAQPRAALASVLVALQMVLSLVADTHVLPLAPAFVRGVTVVGAALVIVVALGVRRFALGRGIAGPFTLMVAALTLGFVMQAFVCLLPQVYAATLASVAGARAWLVLKLAVQVVWVVSLACLGYGLCRVRRGYDFYGDLFMAMAVAWTLCMAVQLACMAGVLGMSSLTMQDGFTLVFTFASGLCYVAFALLLRHSD